MSQVSPRGPLPGPPPGSCLNVSGVSSGHGPGGRGFFFWARRNHVVDATTRSDTTCSRRWGQTTDLSARLADSASQGRTPSVRASNGQLTRAGQFYHSITGRRPPSRQFDESQPLIRDGPNVHPDEGGHAKAREVPPDQRPVPCY